MRPIIFFIGTLVLAFLGSTTPSLSQPGAMWIRNFDSGAAECFFDVYAVSDSGYIAVGASGQMVHTGGSWFMVRIDSEGHTIWTHEYGNEVNSCWAWSVIEADNGDFLAAGASGWQGGVDVIRVNADGEQLWRRQYLAGKAKAVIELKNGNFLICGEEQIRGFLLLINGGGDELWSRIYPIGNERGANGYFTSMRETDNQVVVSGEGRRSQNEMWHTWLVKVDLEAEGNILWQQHHFAGRYCTCNTIISCEGGFVLSGLSGGFNAYLMKVNDLGELLWSRIYDNQVDIETGYCLAKLEGGGYGIAGRANNVQNRTIVPFIIRTSAEGGELGRSYYHLSEREGMFEGTNAFYSIVLGLDNSAVGAGCVHVGNQNYDGLIMKWETDHPGPFFVSWTPEDTLLSCLPGDSIQFAVHARHQWQEQFEKLWWLTGGDTLSRDTTVTITFEELGEYEVNCEIRDNLMSARKTWHVTAEEFYLRSFRPDSTEIIIRRNNSIDFLLDIASVEGVELSYNWLLTGREEGELEGEDSVSVNFSLAGDYELTAQVSEGEENDGVTWQIQVSSIVWWWWPHELQFSAPVDTTMEFEVSPFNMESDSMAYRWELDGEMLEDVSNLIELTFNEVRNHQLIAYVAEGAENDTVQWDFEIRELQAADHEGQLALPTEISLSPNYPNPFNSTTRLTFQLPASQFVSLELVDIRGRLVSELINDLRSAGNHEFLINSDNLTTGIYLVNLRANGECKTQKLVLIR